MQCSAALYERICTIPFPPSFFSYACMHAWLGFSSSGSGAGAVIVVVFVFVERNLRRRREEREVG